MSRMLRVTILHEPWYSSTGIAFLFPLYVHRRALAAHGVALRFTTRAEEAFRATDVLGVTSRFCKHWWRDGGVERVTRWLEDARRAVGRVVWFDLTESTGTTHFAVLPYVDRYAKMQALRDRSGYLQQYIGGRIFTDYYARLFGVRDSEDVDAHLAAPADPEHLEKIVVSWNAGLAHYGVLGPKWHHLWHHSRGVLPRWYAHRWTAPRADRQRALSCRIGTYHHRATVAAPRKELARRLAAHLQTQKIPRAAFFAEMRQSRATLSPFGLGDITLRDFEAVICGAAVLKQDMGHVETWPDLWVPGTTYLPFAWDFSDLDARIDDVLCDPQRTIAIAAAAQERYRSALFSSAGREEFCERFLSYITCLAPSATSRTAPPAAVRSRA
ncbi:MAG: glycosyltransferase [bacterium]|nr:glycosyltransferase [bacterium]